VNDDITMMILMKYILKALTGSSEASLIFIHVYTIV
jgi:hypothetical protein